jgi:hypothetical protein
LDCLLSEKNWSLQIGRTPKKNTPPVNLFV